MNVMKLMGVLGNLGKVQKDMQAIAEELATHRYHGRAGGDMVQVTVSGAMKMIACRIDPKLLADNEQEMLEELIVTACNDAYATAKSESGKYMQKRMAEKLDMPELNGMLSGVISKFSQ